MRWDETRRDEMGACTKRETWFLNFSFKPKVTQKEKEGKEIYTINQVKTQEKSEFSGLAGLDKHKNFFSATP